MKHFFIRTQVVLVSIVLFLTFAMMMALVLRFNRRWDFTQEKLYSLSAPTELLLKELTGGVLDILAFYPNDDPARRDFEIFLKEAQVVHGDLKYRFYDPDRVPKLARDLSVKDLYTVILRYGAKQERIIQPNEETFANALFRLAHPKVYQICFVSGHNEASLSREDRNGLRLLRDALESNNYAVHEIILARDKVPATCHVAVLAGPHRDLDPEEWSVLKKAFDDQLGLLVLLDPMDPGTGKSFHDFLQGYGVVLGQDVIVDKMSRMVGGDFLVPLVSQYVSEHDITAAFDLPTFFPVARSMQPSADIIPDIETVPLAFTSSGSWAERNLDTLERGEAVFEPESDLAGPICLAVASEKKLPGQLQTRDDITALSGEQGLALTEEKSGGRLVAVGDSDFLTNAYLELSGNQAFTLKTIQWLTKDNRKVSLATKGPDFKPLILDAHKRFVVLVTVLIIYPLSFLAFGGFRIFLRRR